MRGLSSRYSSLVAFIVCHAVLMLGLRFSAIHSDPEDFAISSTEVFLTEALKLVLSVAISFAVDARGSLPAFFSQLERAFVDEGVDLLKLCVPAFLYTIQNNLQYVIETAPLFMVMYQMKIITTAIFFSYMLARRLTVRDWLTIIALAFGVSMVQSSQTDVHIHHASNFIGVISVICACLTSGFAGVYFEKTLKSSKSSIWMINVELSLLSTALAMFACLIEDTEEISRRGFFHGYNKWVLLVIFLQATAGLVVALVVKYADNIFKGFAGGISTVLTTILDYALFDDTPITKGFVLGTLIVVAASAAFALSQARKEAAVAGAAGIVGTEGGGALLETGGARERLVSAENLETKKGGVDPNGVSKSPQALRWVQRLSASNAV